MRVTIKSDGISKNTTITTDDGTLIDAHKITWTAEVGNIAMCEAVLPCVKIEVIGELRRVKVGDTWFYDDNPPVIKIMDVTTLGDKERKCKDATTD